MTDADVVKLAERFRDLDEDRLAVVLAVVVNEVFRRFGDEAPGIISELVASQLTELAA